MGVGGTLDFIAGTQRRAPVLMQRTGTEWLHRLLRDPSRLTRRYALDIPRFAYIFSLQWWYTLSGWRSRLALSPSIEPGARIQVFEENREDFVELRLPALWETPAGFLELMTQIEVILSRRQQNRKQFVLLLQMQNVKHIGSFGLITLVHLARQVRLAGGCIRLSGVSTWLIRSFRRHKLERLLSFHGSPSEADDEVKYHAGMNGDVAWGVLVVPRRLDVECVDRIGNFVDPEGFDMAHFVFDLSHTDYLDSAGISWLHAVSKSLVSRGTEVRVMGMRQSLQRFLELSGYDRDFFNRNTNPSDSSEYTWYPTKQIQNIDQKV
jgi:anti-anti-sigma factor